MSDILMTRAEGVLSLRLNRPAKKNAITRAMYMALTDGLRQASADPDVKVVVLLAEGSDFCAGNDILDFAQGAAAFQTDDLEALPVFSFLKALTYFDKPLIAAVQGQAVGVGVTLLLHCDLVVATEDVRLKLPFLQLGLVPEAGSTLLLPRRIGHARAFEWLALGEAVSSRQALDWGLVNRVVAPEDLDTRVMAMAQRMARLPTEALRQTRVLLRDPEEVWAVVRAEGEIFRSLLTSPEAMAAFGAFLNKA